MDPLVLTVFVLVYLGMILGGLPGLALDRTGVALLGAIVLVGTERLSPEEAWAAIDVPTIGLLFGLMVVSAQFRLGGFYSRFTRSLAGLPVRPEILLGLVIFAAGLLSAVLTNDIICLAMAPVLIEGCGRRQLNPVPFLLGLACAANVGSAATLIGNPQNILIGQMLDLSFSWFLWQAGVPALLGLVAVWWLIRRRFRDDWNREGERADEVQPDFNTWQTMKGAIVVIGLMIAFLFNFWPREVVALGGAGLILTSRRTESRRFLALVDWHLLALFAGLFVVNHALAASGALEIAEQSLRSSGIDVAQPGWLFVMTVLLSNLVSNVPATMLLLPVATHPLAGPVLALSSTLAGNLLIVGSIANIIVVDQAARYGIRIDWLAHAKVGVPVTVVTLSLAAVWLAVLSFGV